MSWSEKKKSCNALGMNFPKPSLRSSSSDVEKSPQDMSGEKNQGVSNRTCFSYSFRKSAV